MNELNEKKLLEALKCGVKRSSDLIARITNFHGGPVTTEYMLTSDIARELIERHHEVAVEYLNRKMVNAMTAKNVSFRKVFGKQRTDIAVLDSDIIPLGIIEVKIGVKTFRGIAKDLGKIIKTIESLKPEFASRVWGVSVFQVHVSGNSHRYKEDQFKKAIDSVEKKIHSELKTYANSKTDYRLALHPLQSAETGIVPRELAPDGDGLAWGQHGHAIRFYAVLIKSALGVPPPKTFKDLMGESDV